MMKKVVRVSIIGCLICLLGVIGLPHASAITKLEFDINCTNYLKLKSWIDTGAIYDLGLYTNMEDAVSILKDIYPKFDALCKDSKNTVKSLAYYLRNEEVDPFIQFLLITLYDYLGGNAFSICTEPQYSNYNLVLPSGKVIKAKKYIGSSTPDEYDSIKNYPSVVKVGAESYRYNCHSYAWLWWQHFRGSSRESCIH